MSLLLPNDLLVQILLRLPVKSLLRFKCVSKSWLSLISDPHFARSHYELAAAHTHRLINLHTHTLEGQSLDLDASLHNDFASATMKLNVPLPKYSSITYILGSCRGFLLLCCYPYSYLYLWNPSTSALKQLPLSLCSYSSFYGFGYDPSTDDYLVVQAPCKPSASDCVAQFLFFSMMADSWAKIEGPRLPYSYGLAIHPNAGLLLNEALHWPAFHDDLRLNIIVAFDLVEKSFSEMSLPNDDECHHNLPYLWVHGAFLSICVLESNVRASIWVMKEYKVQSSWTKSVIVPLHDIPGGYISPVCSTRSGHIYGQIGIGELVKCNAKGELLEHSSYLGLESTSTSFIGTNAAMYTESLLPLPVPGDMKC